MRYMTALLTMLTSLYVFTQAGGVLDPSFGTNGIVTTSIGPVSDMAWDVALQDDGKIVAVGFAGITSNPFSNDFGTARYTSSGQLDPTFGSGGTVMTNISGDDQARAVGIQPDGKIVVVGTSSTNSNGNITIVRYNVNGTLDNTFGSNGVVVRSTSVNDAGFSLAIQPDGKLLVGGSATVGGTLRMIVARYNPNGLYDNSFGAGGEVILNFGHTAAGVFDMEILLDGRILLGGYSGNTNARDFAVVRLNADGSLDGSFGTGGSQITSLSPGNDFGRGLAIQEDGKILLCGDTRIGNDVAAALLRYSVNGILDLTFGTNGFVTLNQGPGDDIAQRVVVDSDGGILFVGQVADGAAVQHALVRHLSTGALDISFGSNGIASLPNSSGSALVQQEDGRIVTVGRMVNGGLNEFLVTRYFEPPTHLDDPNVGASIRPRIYPNPSTGSFTIEHQGERSLGAELMVLDAMGRVVVKPYTVIGTDRFILDLEGEASGVYFLRLTTPEGVFTRELVIQR